MAIPTEKGPILIWDVSAKRQLGWLRGHSLRASGLVFSRDSKRLASASEDGSVRWWDLLTRRELATLRSGADSHWGLALSPDARRLASGTGDGRVVLWDLITGQIVATFRVQRSGMIGQIRFTPDGHALLATGVQILTVTRWRADSP